MAFSIFEDKAVEPTDDQVAEVLGDVSPFWEEVIHDAPKYAEGTGFRIEVYDKKIVQHIKKLIDIKIAN